MMIRQRILTLIEQGRTFEEAFNLVVTDDAPHMSFEEYQRLRNTGKRLESKLFRDAQKEVKEWQWCPARE